MSETDQEHSLKLELMRMDLNLKTKQAFWETPLNLTILLATVATLVGAVSGVLGFKLGQSQPQPIILQVAPTPAR